MVIRCNTSHRQSVDWVVILSKWAAQVDAPATTPAGQHLSDHPVRRTSSQPGKRLGKRTLAGLVALAAIAVTLPPALLAGTTSAAAAVVPCPIAKAPPSPGAKTPPKPPVPPPTPPVEHPAGGDQLGASGLVLPAGAKPLPAGISATSWVVADLGNGSTPGTVLGACGAHVRHPPASTLKLLTLLASLPRVRPTDLITATKADINVEPGSSSLGMVAGGKYRVSTLLTGMMLVSGNDAAQTVARLAGGSGGVPATIATMNRTAKDLGALDTTAANPHGLDAPTQFTSAYDLALIANAAFARPDFRTLAATKTAQVPAQRVTQDGKPKYLPGYQIQNDNKLLTRLPGTLGGKSGFTDLARHTYVAVARRGDRTIVATLMNAETRPAKTWEQGGRLLSWGFAQPSGPGVGTLVRPTPPSAQPAGGAAANQPNADKAAGPQDTGRGVLIAVAAGIGVGLLAVLVALFLTFRRGHPSRRSGSR